MIIFKWQLHILNDIKNYKWNIDKISIINNHNSATLFFFLFFIPSIPIFKSIVSLSFHRKNQNKYILHLSLEKDLSLENDPYPFPFRSNTSKQILPYFHQIKFSTNWNKTHLVNHQIEFSRIPDKGNKNKNRIPETGSGDRWSRSSFGYGENINIFL